ncbi:hypothetical protein [Verminephrobacter aporrectodeae]|nr:hypothetical protein [Verminephrobacter aporrectodeae]
MEFDEASAVIDDFVADYKGVEHIDFIFAKTQEELYGKDPRNQQFDPIKGAYHPSQRDQGAITVVLANVRDAADLRETIQHEAIGHYGTLTFNEGQKRALMAAIIGSRASMSMADDWSYIDHHYANISESMKAEEIFCLAAERIRKPTHDLPSVNVVWVEVVVNCRRPMEQRDLHILAEGVADGLARGTRIQQIFPINDHSQYRGVVSCHMQRFEDVQKDQIHGHAMNQLDINAAALASDVRYVQHTGGELAKAAYFRGVHEKASEFNGIAPDFAKYDAIAANCQTLCEFPDVSELEGRKMPKQQRANDGNSL